MQRSKSVTKHASSSAMASSPSGRPVRLKPLALAIAVLLQAGRRAGTGSRSAAPGWWSGLVVMAASLAAGFAMMSSQSDVATDSLAHQTDQVSELAKKYHELNAAQVLSESGKIHDEIEKQNHEIDLQINKLAMLAMQNEEMGY